MGMSEREPRWRLFVAIETPSSWKSYLADVQAQLEERLPGEIRWVHPELLHLTLVFLAEQPVRELAEIQAAITGVAEATPAFRLDLGQPGTFGRAGSVGVIWTGVEDRRGVLEPLHQQLVQALVATGIQFEAGRFQPHLTLGRARDREHGVPVRQLQAVLRGLPHRRRPAGFPVRSLALFRSQLYPSGPIYTVLSEHALAPAARVAEVDQEAEFEPGPGSEGI